MTNISTEDEQGHDLLADYDLPAEYWDLATFVTPAGASRVFEMTARAAIFLNANRFVSAPESEDSCCDARRTTEKGSIMFYEHFGLSGAPFAPADSLTPLFLDSSHRDALALLEWSLQEPSDFTMLVGESGTGKTTLIYSLLARAPSAKLAFVTDPNVTFMETLRIVVAQLGITPGHLGKLELIEAIDECISGRKSGEAIGIIVDEAQNLSDSALEELRLLSNPRLPGRKPLKLVLVGQPALARRLKQPSLRQLDQRIGARGVLAPLKREELRAYVEFRLRARGGELDKLFSPAAVRQVMRWSRGIPQRINVLCNNAMLLVCSRGGARVEASHVKEAARIYENRTSSFRSVEQRGHLSAWMKATACGVMAFALLGFVFFLPAWIFKSNGQTGHNSHLAGLQDGDVNEGQNPVKRSPANDYGRLAAAARSVSPEDVGFGTSMMSSTGAEAAIGSEDSTWNGSPGESQPQNLQSGSEIRQVPTNPNVKAPSSGSDNVSVGPSSPEIASRSEQYKKSLKVVRADLAEKTAATDNSRTAGVIPNRQPDSSSPIRTLPEQPSSVPEKIAYSSGSLDIFSAEIADGDAAMADGNYDKALLKYRTALALNEDNAKALRKIERAHSAMAAEKSILK
jgi:MSHA biogenesis protein MshM